MRIFLLLSLLSAAMAPAAIIDTINAMPDNTWLQLPQNGPQPITRSSSNVMHYDGDSVGYLWGTCHAGPHNDLWAFNLAANRWREVQATEPSVQADPLVIKNQDSVVMTRLGRPLSFHQWSTMDFDSDRKMLWRNTYNGWQGLYSGHDSVICQYQPGPLCNVHTRCKVMGKYDPVQNKWSPVKFPPFTWPLTCSTCGEQYMVFRYIPYLQKFVCIVWGYWSDTYVLVDPVNQTLQTVKVTLQPIAGDGGASSYGLLGNAVWDSYREKLIYVGSSTGTWAFDPKAMTMKQIASTAGSPTVWTDCATSHMVYDSGNRCVLVYTTPGMQTCYGGGTWPARAAVYVLDYEGGKWDLMPAPSSGESPANTGAQHGHGYFDRKLGVIFHYEGGYCGAGTGRWIYKYKTVQAATEKGLPGTGVSGLQVFPSGISHSAVITVPRAAAGATLKVYSMSGRMVVDLSSGIQAAPRVAWNANRVPAGVYVICFRDGDTRLSAKAMILR